MFKPILSYCKEWASNIFQVLRLRFKSSAEKDLEIIALRSQLALYFKKTKYLIHDNDPVFNYKVFQKFLGVSNIESKPTSYRSPWQNPYAERVNGLYHTYTRVA